MNKQEDIYQIIARNIKAVRKQLKLTQEAVSERAGMTPNFYGQIERGTKKGSIVTIKRIADALNVTPGELFTEGVSKPKKDMVMSEINRLLKGRSLKDRKIALRVLKDIFLTR